MEDSQRFFVYIGSYAASSDSSIYTYTFDERTGQLTPVTQFSGIENPSFLTFNSQRTRIYAVSETTSYRGQPGGSLVALERDAVAGSLRILDQQPTNGADPCYVAVDPTDSMLMFVNYTGGSFGAYSLTPDGRLDKMTTFIQRRGKGFRPDRQEAPHPHSIVLDPQGKHALVSDLGLDTITVYRLDLTTKQLIEESTTTLEPGTGPRHTVFSQDSRYVYTINELASSINVFTYDSEQGTLQHIQSIAATSSNSKEKNISADIHISPDGRFLYGSNRGQNTIAAYAIDQKDGTLSLIQHISCGGSTPRNFAITPFGHFLLVANQDTNNVVMLRRDQAHGTLEPTETVLHLARPVCIKLCPVA